MKKLVIGLSCMALMLGSAVEQQAEAFKFGPRLGVYSESFDDGACYKEKEFGLQAALAFTGHPKKVCKQGRCGQPLPQPRMAVPYMAYPQIQTTVQYAQPVMQPLMHSVPSYVQPVQNPQVQIIQQR